MKYKILLACLTMSPLAFAGNGSGWGGTPSLSDQEMQAMSAPLEAWSMDDEILLRSSDVRNLVMKTQRGLPVALNLHDETMLVRPVEILELGKLELETPMGDRLVVREIQD